MDFNHYVCISSFWAERVSEIVHLVSEAYFSLFLSSNFAPEFSLTECLLFLLFCRGERKPKVDPKIELFRTCIAAIPRC